MCHCSLTLVSAQSSLLGRNSCKVLKGQLLYTRVNHRVRSFLSMTPPADHTAAELRFVKILKLKEVFILAEVKEQQHQGGQTNKHYSELIYSFLNIAQYAVCRMNPFITCYTMTAVISFLFWHSLNPNLAQRFFIYF